MLGFILLASSEVYSQGCPACSNPALQSSEKLEAGVDTLYKGTFRTTLNVINGYNYQGGHANNHGLSPDGNVIEVPLHNHIVDLDFVRSEFSFEYTFKTNWTGWLRVPYDVKMQTASIEFVKPLTSYEQGAILRNRDIHHRTENYSGLSDFRLLVAHRINGVLSKKGRLDFAFGTSLPIGKTEDDPLKAKNEGEKHLHIQFGTGTFDPLLEFHFVTSLTKKTSFGLFTINKFPFYQNGKTYQAPVETTSGISLGYKLKDWLSARTTIANFSQGFAKWDGTNDPNSGLISYNLSASLNFKLKNGLMITPGYRLPLYQKTLLDEGDTFEYGQTFLLNLSYLFEK
jgi:hypothetical protein